MSKFKIVTAITGSLVAGVLLGAALFGGGQAAASERDALKVTAQPVAPSDDRISSAIARLVRGENLGKGDKDLVAWALDSTRGYARAKKCAMTRFSGGEQLSAEGEWYEADLVGKTLEGIGTNSTRASARLKLSYHNGVCYLKASGKGVTSEKLARNGAVRRLALAYSKKTGQTVALTTVDGKRTIGVYRWSKKWDA